MNRRSFLAALLAVPLALLAWRSKPKAFEQARIPKVRIVAGSHLETHVEVWERGRQLIEGSEFEFLPNLGCIRVFRG